MEGGQGGRGGVEEGVEEVGRRKGEREGRDKKEQCVNTSANVSTSCDASVHTCTLFQQASRPLPSSLPTRYGTAIKGQLPPPPPPPGFLGVYQQCQDG